MRLVALMLVAVAVACGRQSGITAPGASHGVEATKMLLRISVNPWLGRRYIAMPGRCKVTEEGPDFGLVYPEKGTVLPMTIAQGEEICLGFTDPTEKERIGGTDSTYWLNATFAVAMPKTSEYRPVRISRFDAYLVRRDDDGAG